MPRLRFLFLVALCALSAGPAGANLVVEPTYQEKMTQADLVVIGTVTASDRGGRYGFGSNATLSVLQRLKGEGPDTIIVTTYSPIGELSPHCCEVGATYLMFLVQPAHGGQLQSIRGVYGMVRVGGPPRVYQVLPSSEN